jgi:hypothetical protein
MSLDGESFKLIIREADFNNKTVTAMSKISNTKQPIMSDSPSTAMEAPREISSFRYNKAIQHMILLRSMEVITNDEVKRLVSQLQSPDHENWTVAEECINQKFSEI